MALSVVDQPYEWTLRGQRLLYRISSTNVSQDGFKYGVSVTDVATGKVYTFFVDRSPATSDLLFDLAPVVKMFNDESTPDMHTAPTHAPWSEPLGGSWKSFTIQFSEWWIVGGVLTDNQEYLNSTRFILNGYYQPYDGYKPSVDSAGTTQLALTSTTSRAWSDRQFNTHTWWNLPSGFGGNNNTQTTMIPCLNSDYGLLYVPLKTSLAGNAYEVTISLWAGFVPLGSATQVLSGNEILGVGVYPMNINDSSLPSFVKPASNPTWTHYQIRFRDNSSVTKSMNYIFYDQEKTGQFDCRYDYVRLAWVNSRSGWDYANFIKKNEVSNEFERKQYKKLLMNNLGTFNNWQRQLTDRQTIVTQTLTITSDWIQENEFVFLRGLFASNQVELIDTTSDKSLGYRKPVSIIDTSFVEKKERNGKLYNITIKIKYSQDYWT
jgi:hypothetical protein